MASYSHLFVAGTCIGLVYILKKVFQRIQRDEYTGIKYCIKWIIARILLYLRTRSSKRRFDLYSYADFDPYKWGVLPPPEEYELDAPTSTLSQKTDDLTIWCSNSTGDCVLARICRHRDSTAEAWLYVRTAHGDVYVLPNTIVPDLSGGCAYSAGGLRLEQLIPMRRWRIAYNGLLRCTTKAGADIHVKIGLICNSASNVVDYSTDVPKSFLAQQFAKHKWVTAVRDMRVLEEIDSYVQTAFCVGSIKAENEKELEVFMWGLRIRRNEKEFSESDALGEIIGYTKSGITFHLYETIERGTQKRLQVGMVGLPSTDVALHRKCSTDVMTDGTAFKKRFRLFAGKFEFQVQVNGAATDSYTFPLRRHGSLTEVTVGHYPFKMDTSGGYLLYISSSRQTENYCMPRVPAHIATRVTAPPCQDLVLELTQPQCKLEALTGGKGSSLSILTTIAQNDPEVLVPEGIVVTTAAYHLFVGIPRVNQAIQELESATGFTAPEFKQACTNAVNTLKSVHVPNEVELAIKVGLLQLFGEEAHRFQYAVRSSATGEDSEDMSSAGQMETILGVLGLDNVVEAVSQCWASQFSHVACSYKRRYGQPINIPMAVVIQRMVNSDVAGVMFTCDIVTGNPRHIVITANHGLGESVVSGKCEPDTIVLERSASGNLSLEHFHTGSKQEKVILGSNGTELVRVSNSCQEKCLTEKQALQLGKLGQKLEREFCGPRDIEWTLAGGRFYILQARPVTSLLQESDIEIMHENDMGFRTSDECITKANIGEVMNGAQSPMLASFLPNVLFLTKKKNASAAKHLHSPYHERFLIYGLGNMFLPASHEMMNMSSRSFLGKAMAYAFRGGLINDDDIKAQTEERSRLRTKRYSHFGLLGFIQALWSCEKNIEAAYNVYKDAEIPVRSVDDSERVFEEICNNLLFLSEGVQIHPACNFYSTIANVFALALLAYENGGWNDTVLSDFATLLASCKDVVSAEIPRALQEIALSVAERPEAKLFKNMNAQHALSWLENDKLEAGSLFRAFLQKHGHRCVNGYDPYSKTWAMDPSPIIQSLQSLIDEVGKYSKKEVSTEEAIDQLRIPLSPLNRRIMKFILEKCRKGVAYREHSKNIFVKVTDIFRKAMLHLAQRMTSECRLPDPELIFFLTIPEISVLLRTRSPKLVAKAIRRHRHFPAMKSLKFPEFVKGIPTAVSDDNPQDNIPREKVLKGTPVSQGVVVGPARVVKGIDGAANIKKGEILITYSTDIAWSPYFSLLAGVATELGGLISHGAVVAREYGLPCVVGVHGATTLFQSGDKVRLDGSRGILEAIEERSQEE